MPIIDTYIRRKREAERTGPDVYQYDSLPSPLRIQIRHIWDDAIGPYSAPSSSYFGDAPAHNSAMWEQIRADMSREFGTLTLSGEKHPKQDCVQFLTHEQDIDKLLTVIEYSFRLPLVQLGRADQYKRHVLGIKVRPQDAIEELNFRLREAGVGYQLENGRIIRVDSAFVHAEVVRPALQLLSDPRFKGPQEEFMAAHAHYRAGEYKDCVTDALNAFESTMKAICDIKKWECNKGARASDLVKVIRKNGLLPDYLDAAFDQLVATLMSGLPKVRNEAGGHGQGAEPRETPGYVAAYALHLAAAKIVLLVDALKASEGGA